MLPMMQTSREVEAELGRRRKTVNKIVTVTAGTEIGIQTGGVIAIGIPTGVIRVTETETTVIGIEIDTVIRVDVTIVAMTAGSSETVGTVIVVATILRKGAGTNAVRVFLPPPLFVLV